jgi:orotidine-5'-phosphate decarboxylase
MKSHIIPPAQRLIVALDVRGRNEALGLVERLRPYGLAHVKVGMSLFYEAGMGLVEELREQGLSVFVDLKLHDIPETVARTVDVLVKGGANFLNVHTLGGLEMMKRAAEQAKYSSDAMGIEPITLIGVTMLTSHRSETLKAELHISTPLSEQVLHLAQLAKNAGLDGVVCSAQEAHPLKEALGSEFLKVTPGIRPSSYTEHDDQHRIVTPALAIQQGATHLVVGRPIYGAKHPEEAFSQILAEITQAD